MKDGSTFVLFVSTFNFRIVNVRYLAGLNFFGPASSNTRVEAFYKFRITEATILFNTGHACDQP